MDKNQFNESLLLWYDQSKRILPWRDNPNPYHVWVSEIMLQQTRVETVIPFFNRFIKELPTIKDLSEVDDDFLNKLWEGLGYYSRARNLKKAAIKVVEEFSGMLPNNQKDLESLSGIGPYTSGAILSIAFNQKHTAVDGNVLRVFARLQGIKENIKEPSIKKRISMIVTDLLPNQRVGDFNQGLMEIGAKICLPNGKPKCIFCPLKDHCIAYNENLTDMIPAKQIKKKRKSVKKQVLLFECKGLYGIEKRSDNGLLGGLYQFPNNEELYNLTELIDIYKPLEIIQLKESKHIFTHLLWNIETYLVKLENQLSSLTWVTHSEINDVYSIPTAFKVCKEYIQSKHKKNS